MDRILEWIAENPVYAGVIIAAAVIIIVLVILLIVRSAKKSKRKKEQAAQADSASVQVSEAQPIQDVHYAGQPADDTDSAPYAEEQPATAKAAETQPEPYAAEAAPAPLPEENVVPAEENAASAEEEPVPVVSFSEDEAVPAAQEEPAEEPVHDAEEHTVVPEITEGSAQPTADNGEEAKKDAEPATEEPQHALTAEKTEKTIKESKPAPKKRTAKANETTKKPAKTAEQKSAKPAKSEEPEKRSAYAGKWLIFKNEDKSCYFELRASNGEKLLRSLNYTSLQGAKSAINTYRNNIAKGNLSIAQSKTGQYYFQLLSGSKQLLCTGETYSSRPSCESAVESVKRFAETAVVTVAAEEPADE